MSRCFPFPPPGYVRNGVSGEALLELIKVQRERVKAEKERNKEEKRKRKKESEQSKRKHGHDHNRHKRLRSNEGEERSESKGKSKSKSEHEPLEMERRSLTEELEQQPILDSLYESSDNSRSICRKRGIISYCNECHDHALSCNGMMDSVVVQKKLELPVEIQFHSASAMPARAAGDVQEFVSPPLDKKSEITAETESQFREFIVKWIPSPLQIEHFDVDDQEWLFKRISPRSDILETSSNGGKDQFLLHSSATRDSKVQKKLELDPEPVSTPTPPQKVLCHSSSSSSSSSQGAGIDTGEKPDIAPTSSCSEISLQQIESLFTELVVNRPPTSLQFESFDIGDQEWLFRTKKPSWSKIRDTSTAGYDVFSHQGNFTHAHANIYALPYTVLY